MKNCAPRPTHTPLSRAVRIARAWAAGASAIAAVSQAVSLQAQGPRGAGPDARTPAAGTLRVGMAATWTRSAERYENGLLRPIGDRFTFASLGADAVRALGPIESAARAATGAQDFRASLGGVATQARSRF